MATLSQLKPLVLTEQARENRAYVRRLLKEKQPEFAAMLELAAGELLAGTRGERPAGARPAGAAGSAAVGCRCC